MDQSHFNTVEDVRKSGRHLYLKERGMMQVLHRQGLSLRRITAEVGYAHTTVFYELRCGTPMRKSSCGRARSTPQSVVIKLISNIVGIRGSPTKPIAIIVSHSSNGWPRSLKRIVGHWMPALATPSFIICSSRNRYLVLRRSTTYFG